MVCYAVWFNHRDQRAAVAAAGGGVAVYGYAAGVDSAVGVGAIAGNSAAHGDLVDHRAQRAAVGATAAGGSHRVGIGPALHKHDGMWRAEAALTLTLGGVSSQQGIGRFIVLAQRFAAPVERQWNSLTRGK